MKRYILGMGRFVFFLLCFRVWLFLVEFGGGRWGLLGCWGSN